MPGNTTIRSLQRQLQSQLQQLQVASPQEKRTLLLNFFNTTHDHESRLIVLADVLRENPELPASQIAEDLTKWCPPVLKHELHKFQIRRIPGWSGFPDELPHKIKNLQNRRTRKWGNGAWTAWMQLARLDTLTQVVLGVRGVMGEETFKESHLNQYLSIIRQRRAPPSNRASSSVLTRSQSQSAMSVEVARGDIAPAETPDVSIDDHALILPDTPRVMSCTTPKVDPPRALMSLKRRESGSPAIERPRKRNCTSSAVQGVTQNADLTTARHLPQEAGTAADISATHTESGETEADNDAIVRFGPECWLSSRSIDMAVRSFATASVLCLCVAEFPLLAHIPVRSRPLPSTIKHVFIYMNTDNHWVFVHIDRTQMEGTFYDSCRAYSKFTTQMVAQLVEFAVKYIRLEWSPATWKTIHKQDLPQQSNIYDCGVFALVFILHLTAKVDLPKQVDGDYWRNILRLMITNISIEEAFAEDVENTCRNSSALSIVALVESKQERLISLHNTVPTMEKALHNIPGTLRILRTLCHLCTVEQCHQYRLKGERQAVKQQQDAFAALQIQPSQLESAIKIETDILNDPMQLASEARRMLGSFLQRSETALARTERVLACAEKRCDRLGRMKEGLEAFLSLLQARIQGAKEEIQRIEGVLMEFSTRLVEL